MEDLLPLFWKASRWLFLALSIVGFVLALRVRGPPRIYFILSFGEQSLSMVWSAVKQTIGSDLMGDWMNNLVLGQGVLDLLGFACVIKGVYVLGSAADPVEVERVKRCPRCTRPAKDTDGSCVECGTSLA
ncbi:MAG: hypothetical protein VX938_06245 [Myxococcota bacterium]|nr:hypothetical protein [Myxococcota bacterium]